MARLGGGVEVMVEEVVEVETGKGLEVEAGVVEIEFELLLVVSRLRAL